MVDLAGRCGPPRHCRRALACAAPQPPAQLTLPPSRTRAGPPRSERMKKSGAANDPKLLKETQHINKSLSALGEPRVPRAAQLHT